MPYLPYVRPLIKICAFRSGVNRKLISPLLPRSENRQKKPAVTGWFFEDFWSAREDLNLRPRHPIAVIYLLIKGNHVPEAALAHIGWGSNNEVGQLY